MMSVGTLERAAVCAVPEAIRTAAVAVGPECKEKANSGPLVVDTAIMECAGARNDKTCLIFSQLVLTVRFSAVTVYMHDVLVPCYKACQSLLSL